MMINAQLLACILITCTPIAPVSTTSTIDRISTKVHESSTDSLPRDSYMSCDSTIDCRADNSICFESKCRCAHSFFPHFNHTSQTWSCLPSSEGSTCCVREFTVVVNTSQWNIGENLERDGGVDKAVYSSITDCRGGQDVCKGIMGHYSMCDMSSSPYGSCQCDHSTGNTYYDVDRQICTSCPVGEYINNACSSLLNLPCHTLTDHCSAYRGYACHYSHKCSCHTGYLYNCDTKRCTYTAVDLYQTISCPHIIQNHLIGTVSCEKKSGCWNVKGSKGLTAGCVDVLVALQPGRCGITCKLEYQGYGECDRTDNGVVCFSCLPGSAVKEKMNLMLVTAVYFPIQIIYGIV